MELIQLKYFRTVAQTGKIAAAAQELFVSAPALSTSISRLEKELGVRLFDRTRNRISLNARGKILLQHTNRIFEELEQAQLELRQSMEQDQQHVRLTATGSNLWLDMVTRFSQEYPHITMTCTSLETRAIVDLFHQHTFLLAEKEEIADSCRDTLECELLFEDQLAILVHPDHPLAKEEFVTFQMLEGETLYLPIRGTPRGERLTGLLVDNGVDLDSATTCPYLISRGFLLQGTGVSFSTTGAKWSAQMDGLSCVPLKNRSEPWQMCLFWRKDHVMTESEMLFKTFVERFYRADRHKV